MKGGAYWEGQSHLLHVTPAVEPNVVIPEKDEEMKKVKVVDSKILAHKEKKNRHASGLKFTITAKWPAGEGGSSRPAKKKKKDDITSVSLKISPSDLHQSPQ